MNYVQEHDAKLVADARALLDMDSSAEIRAWFVSQGRPLDDADNAYAAAFGTLQAVAGQLLRMVNADA